MSFMKETIQLVMEEYSCEVAVILLGYFKVSLDCIKLDCRCRSVKAFIDDFDLVC